MDLNADFSQRVLLHGDALVWTPSPTPGVDRRMLDRIGEEVARATSIVRYAPGSAFPPHTHDGGEEFIVLDGVFQDEHGDYPAGIYVRNPPTSRHKPGSAIGCTIFVKLWQFDPMDRTSVTIDLNTIRLGQTDGRPTVSSSTLFENEHEAVLMEQWAPRAGIEIDAPDGAELLVLDGTCAEAGQAMRKHSWLRVPAGGRITAIAGDGGARVWIKLGGSQQEFEPIGSTKPL